MAFLNSALEVLLIYIASILALCFFAAEVHMVACMLCYLWVNSKYYETIVICSDLLLFYHAMKRLYGGYEDGLMDLTGNPVIDFGLEHMSLVTFLLLLLAGCSMVRQVLGIFVA
ncbi:hypothetical protein HII31_09741 [Pseudocercospora fuligena]|uniref:Uncharacterized protein n=1 Tax=Pseudocercospora fuligena TaxID=685502 RepID=A0A8H6VDZ6_9PEZI|nr:hypothetical protein HII31_09741 [Pseudocercospora fuligena]